MSYQLAERLENRIQPAKQQLGRVLVVEDDELVSRILVRALSSLSLEVRAVECASSAQDQLSSTSFDAIFSDLRLPGEDWQSVLHAARAIDPNVPFIILTGGPDLSSAATCLAAGVSRYLLKPVAPKILQTIAAAAVEQSRTARLLQCMPGGRERARALFSVSPRIP